MKLKRRNNFEIDIEPIDLNLFNNEPLNAVLIIGNGFDKSLGLNTGYSDFIQDETFKSLLKINNKFAKYLLEKKELNNWIDIELELSIYTSRYPKSNNEFEKEFDQLSSQLQIFLKNIDIRKKNKKSKAYKLIEEIISFKTLIIDFNYTDSISNILKELKYDNNLIQHIKVHGTLKDDNIIFGVDDKADLIPKYIFLKKSVHKNYSAINFSKFLSESDSIGIFGHSLGETDHMYFSDFFSKTILEKSSMSGKNICIYHHGEKGRQELHSQLDKLTRKSIAKFKQQNNVEFIDTI